MSTNIHGDVPKSSEKPSQTSRGYSNSKGGLNLEWDVQEASMGCDGQASTNYWSYSLTISLVKFFWRIHNECVWKIPCPQFSHTVNILELTSRHRFLNMFLSRNSQCTHLMRPGFVHNMKEHATSHSHPIHSTRTINRSWAILLTEACNIN